MSTPKYTYKQRLEAGLVSLKWTQEHGGTGKYTTWIMSGIKHKFFVGPSGALRCGSCVTKSRSVGDPTRQIKPYQACLAKGDIALAQIRLAPSPELAMTDSNPIRNHWRNCNEHTHQLR